MKTKTGSEGGKTQGQKPSVKKPLAPKPEVEAEETESEETEESEEEEVEAAPSKKTSKAKVVEKVEEEEEDDEEEEVEARPAVSQRNEPTPASYRAAAPPSSRARKADVKIAVSMDRVTKSFGATRPAVDGVTMDIENGTVFGLIGPNGAGKTTTFSMFAGYLRPTEGNLEMLGVAPHDVVALRGRVGVLPQDAMLPANDRVGEFLIHMAALQGISDREKAARDVLAEVDGAPWWNQKCGTLSHGMAKRVGIAQAFLGNPEVVLLDEPTAGLDPRVAYETRQIIRARKGKTTLIVSSHNLQELEEICDAAAVLDRGRLVANGSISELTASSEEIHVEIVPLPTPPKKKGVPTPSAESRLPIEALRKIPGVKRAEYQEPTHEIVIYFERSQAQAEHVIGQVLWVLLNEKILISGLTKGRSLERRVIELTNN